VDTNNAAYSSADGVLVDKAQSTLIQYPSGKAGGYIIPASVTRILDGAFAWSTGLTSVTIGDNVTSIGHQAFDRCTSLTNVILGTKITSIGWTAFGRCDGLTGLYFRGNAPIVSSEGGFGANHATIYYLPGTTGWGSTLGRRPTAPWRLPYPLILNTSPTFGVKPNGFSFLISWATNRSITVEACTDLTNPAWTPLRSDWLFYGTNYFSDPDWTNNVRRFYRVRWP
jgi:hypothetical protein